MSKRRLLHKIFTLSSSSLLSQCIGIGRGFIIAKYLGPELMGIWATLYICLMYGETLHLGMYNALTRNIPILRGKKDDLNIQRHVNSAFSYTLLSSCFVLLIMSIIIMLTRTSNLYLKQGLIFVTFLLISQQWGILYRFLFMSNNDFGMLSRCQFVYSILSLTGAFLVIPFAFFGQMWGLVLADLAYIGILVCSTNFRFSFELNKSFILKMLKVGFPIYLVGVMFVVLLSVNRLIIVRYLGTTSLGYFSIAFLVFNFVYFLPDSIRAVMYIKMGEDYGLCGEDKTALRKHLLVTTKLLAIVMPLFILLSILVINILVSFLLPKFIPGIQPTIIYVFAVFFFSLASIFANFLNIVKRQAGFLVAQIIAILLNVFVATQMVKKGFGLSGVAFGSFVGYFCYFILMASNSLLMLLMKPIDVMKTIGKLLFPFICLFLILQCLSYFSNISLLQFSLSEVRMRHVMVAVSSVVAYMCLSMAIVYHDIDLRKAFGF